MHFVLYMQRDIGYMKYSIFRHDMILLDLLLWTIVSGERRLFMCDKIFQRILQYANREDMIYTWCCQIVLVNLFHHAKTSLLIKMICFTPLVPKI